MGNHPLHPRQRGTRTTGKNDFGSWEKWGQVLQSRTFLRAIMLIASEHSGSSCKHDELVKSQFRTLFVIPAKVGIQ
jgi:hypothetical protein